LQLSPQFAVAFLVATSVDELCSLADAAQAAFEQQTSAVVDVGHESLPIMIAPNPFREATTIRLVMPTSAEASVEVHDASGRRASARSKVEVLLVRF
jgi:hypothetical protein